MRFVTRPNGKATTRPMASVVISGVSCIGRAQHPGGGAADARPMLAFARRPERSGSRFAGAQGLAFSAAPGLHATTTVDRPLIGKTRSRTRHSGVNAL